MVPTNIPTLSPTQTPSQPPTNNPTQNPTKFPTNIPTISPTISPTITPTIAPSNYPTNTPTIEPTKYPSDAPSDSPTDSPTINPTNAPTAAFSDIDCCHARESTDRYEKRCNSLYFTNHCLSRRNAIRCKWDFDDFENCGIRIKTVDANIECICTFDYDNLQNSRKKTFCERFSDESECLLFNCDWVCLE